MRLLSLAANETLRLDNSVSRNRVLADIAHKSISAFQVGELEERVSSLEGAAYPDTEERRHVSHSGAADSKGRLRLRQGSVQARVERLEVARLSEYAAFGAKVSDVVIAVLERHISDPTLQRTMWGDIATDILAITETRPDEPSAE